jgi:ribosome biogenesis GTPase
MNQAPAQLQQGLVVSTHGRHVVVESDQGDRVLCHGRKKNNTALVGDRVQWLTSTDEGVIEAVLPRKNEFFRQDEMRTKSFAANIDLLLILIAAKPEFSETQLTRALIAAQAAGIEVMIVMNKSDLDEEFKRSWERLMHYPEMGYEMHQLSIKHDPTSFDSVMKRLMHKTTLLLGPSGVGKSTFINHAIPSALVQTQEISLALNSGKHTTTSTTLYWVDAQRSTALIDSPGFQSFGIHQIDRAKLSQYMPDLDRHSKECRFYNCTHLHEPGCAVMHALSQGKISASRYKIYEQLFEELSHSKNF